MNNPRALALRAELEKRGALSPDGKVGAIAPSVSASSRGERLKAIQEELARRGAPQTTSGAEEASPSLLKEIPQAIGKGALSGALKTGMGLATADPMAQEMKMWMSTQDDLSPYVDQHDQILKAGNQELAHRDEETLKNLHSPVSRMAYHGGDWMGSGIVTPGGNVLKGAKAVSTMPALVWEVAKRLGLSLGKDATMGATSGLLQEGGVNPLAADIMAPVVTAVGKKGMQGGKWLFSPDYRREAARPGAEKEIGGILRETMKGENAPRDSWLSRQARRWKENPDAPHTSLEYDPQSVDFSHDINVSEHVNPIQSHQVLPAQAGDSVRKTLLHKLRGLKNKRQEVTDPLYQDLYAVEEGLEPTQGHAVIDQKLKTAKGNTRSHLEKTRRELEANDSTPMEHSPLSFQQREELSLYKSLLAQAENNKFYDPKNPSPTVIGLRKQIQTLEENAPLKRQPTPPEIENTIQWLSDEIGKASKAGETKLAGQLIDVKQALEKDLESIPQGHNYRTKYAEMSKPINEITDHRTLGKMVERDRVTKQYKLSDSEIPAKVISTSMKSVDDAKDLMKHLNGKQGQKARKDLEGTINKLVLDSITDEHGKVSTAKIHTWKKNHPGAFVLYLGLETRLKSLANAQHFTDTLLGKSRNLSVLEAYQSLPLHLFKKLFRKIPAGGKVVELIHKALGKEKEAIRQELLDKALKDPETSQILMTPVREEGKLWQYIQQGLRTGVRVGMGKRESE